MGRELYLCYSLKTRAFRYEMYTIKVLERSNMIFLMSTFSWMHQQFEVFFCCLSISSLQDRVWRYLIMPYHLIHLQLCLHLPITYFYAKFSESQGQSINLTIIRAFQFKSRLGCPNRYTLTYFYSIFSSFRKSLGEITNFKNLNNCISFNGTHRGFKKRRNSFWKWIMGNMKCKQFERRGGMDNNLGAFNEPADDFRPFTLSWSSRFISSKRQRT